MADSPALPSIADHDDAILTRDPSGPEPPTASRGRETECDGDVVELY
ncbi:MAG: hypothetical protein AAF219_06105 [Myxococcota bacterium]